MERILIIGCSGSGKSRMACALGEKLGLPVVHLDQLWWKPGRENVTVEEFDQQLDTVLETQKWIIDGNFSRTMPLRLQYCDTIIYLDYSRWACLLGMCQQALGSPKNVHWDLVKRIWNYNKNNRSLNHTWIAQAKHAQTIVLKNRREAKAFLEELSIAPA